jgi:hypothetical protein
LDEIFSGVGVTRSGGGRSAGLSSSGSCCSCSNVRCTGVIAVGAAWSCGGWSCCCSSSSSPRGSLLLLFARRAGVFVFARPARAGFVGVLGNVLRWRRPEDCGCGLFFSFGVAVGVCRAFLRELLFLVATCLLFGVAGVRLALRAPDFEGDLAGVLARLP